MIVKKIKDLDKKKIAKLALIGGGIMVLAGVSYRIGYLKSGGDIVKLVNGIPEKHYLLIEYRDFWTGKITPVYMNHLG